MGPEWWPIHGAQFDPKYVGGPEAFETRIASATALLHAAIQPAALAERHAAAQDAIDRLGTALAVADVDAVIVIGDDQLEMFPAENIPALALFAGDTLLDLPSSLERAGPSLQAAGWAIHGAEVAEWPAARELGEHLAGALTRDGFDVCRVAKNLNDGTLGHAYTFVNRRLLKDSYVPPMAPVFLNTYYPPNQMPVARCWALGRAIRRAVDAWDNDATVAVVGSGGLSHFVIDEDLDRGVLDALARYDESAIAAIPEHALQSGSSEIKNWVVAGAALEGFTMELVDYIPAYRTAAGTGVGFAFALWHPNGNGNRP